MTRTRALADSALRFGAEFWLPRFQAELGLIPQPADRARQSASGPDPVRVLVLGNGIANGFGVRTQDLALPGHLARELRERTGRGAEVDVDARRGLRIETVRARFAELRLGRYDAVVLTVGPTDAGAVLPLQRWRRALADVLGELRERVRADTTVVVLSVAPLIRSPLGTGWFFARIDDYAARIDEVSAELAAATPATVFVPLAALLEQAGEPGYGSPGGYAAIATGIAERIAPRLAAPSALGARPSGDVPDGEDERLAALQAMGVADAAAGERLTRLVRSARELFGVRGSSLTLVGRDRLHVPVQAGFHLDLDPERAGTLVDRALTAQGAVVLPDVPARLAVALPRFERSRTRFYAAYPIEAPSGHRIGALCLFDDATREAGSIDEVALRDLAAAVQAELWDQAALPSP